MEGESAAPGKVEINEKERRLDAGNGKPAEKIRNQGINKCVKWRTRGEIKRRIEKLNENDE